MRRRGADGAGAGPPSHTTCCLYKLHRVESDDECNEDRMELGRGRGRGNLSRSAMTKISGPPGELYRMWVIFGRDPQG